MLTLSASLLWPMDQLVSTPEGSDKLFHFFGFAALVFPLTRTGRFGLPAIFIGAIAFGSFIELIQPSFNRSADFNDLVADILGIILGTGCGLLTAASAAEGRITFP